MDEAATHGFLDVVKWLHINRTEGCTVRAMNGAAENGHLKVVQWLHASRSEGCTTTAVNKAAAFDHFEFCFCISIAKSTARRKPHWKLSKITTLKCVGGFSSITLLLAT
ncbi:LOW QUALITY PROTEIN: hypothetical protein PHMEG_00041122 [Phytophthora megakarya]|uniref:Uncharacterized protein n=1 Tax=Phytophthora megakarya TaxID=4795 RepID=A0A225UCL8_9STRA|nr:LOW QUALITY PROTEIN: hypothetical protein PHMEG_00041122 [Phytophthora megakarya]